MWLYVGPQTAIIPKTRLRGLLDRDGGSSGPPQSGTAPNNNPWMTIQGGPISGWVIKTNWLDWQPTGPTNIAGSTGANLVDAAITQIQAINAAYLTNTWGSSHPGIAPVGLKLRIYTGIQSPAWVRAAADPRGGGVGFRVYDPAISIGNQNDGVSNGICPFFWTPEFMAAYDQFHQKLAARYDSTPEIHEICINATCTIYAEVVQHQFSGTASVPNTGDGPYETYMWNIYPTAAATGIGMRYTGPDFYTTALDKAAQQAQINVHKAYWLKTRSTFAMTPWEDITINNTDDASWCVDLMNYGRGLMGDMFVYDNHSMRGDVPSSYQTLYANMQSTAGGPPISIQTHQKTTADDLPASIANAAAIGSATCELYTQYKTDYTPATLLAATPYTGVKTYVGLYPFGATQTVAQSIAQMVASLPNDS